jgi:hypothetical protein
MTRPRCADDFAIIHARVIELHRQRALSTGDEDAPSVTEPPLYPDSGDSSLVQKPGIPGWRVARRKREYPK